MTSDEFKIGDRVYVIDAGLAQLRALMRSFGEEPAPNHHGTVTEFFGADLLIEFDDTGSAAPYPASEVRHLSVRGADTE